MQQINHPLLSPALGTQRHLSSWHFGQPDQGPKVYVQASLHADELPGMLVAHHLRGLLEVAEQSGQLLGEVVLVPMANPIGLDQTTMHHQLGRFELASMENFNRNYPDFFALVKDEVAAQLGADAEIDHRHRQHQHIRRLDLGDGGPPHVVLPYGFDTNDMHYHQGFHRFVSARDFADYTTDAFDTLWAEGERSPKMMSIGLHCRLAGRPSRAATLARFLDYVASKPKVWVATREEIARHWMKVHPAKG